MAYLKWLKEIDKKCQGEYIEIACPFLVKGKCSRYAKRFRCCRNFPNPKGYCAKSKCAILKSRIKNNTVESGKKCAQCRKKCCQKIVFPKGIKITKNFIAKWMNIDCESCIKFFG